MSGFSVTQSECREVEEPVGAICATCSVRFSILHQHHVPVDDVTHQLWRYCLSVAQKRIVFRLVSTYEENRQCKKKIGPVGKNKTDEKITIRS